MSDFNIFTTLNNSLDDFNTNSIVLGEGEKETGRFLGKNKNTDHLFSQKAILNDIDFALNSVFKSGKYDTENQRKVYLNKVKFMRDVTRMRTDLDVKDYLMTPEQFEDFWATYCMSRKFKQWAKEENYGELMNDLQDDYCSYGTAVLKRISKSIERVPLKTIKNTQNCKSLKTAAKMGGYVILEHEKTLFEMQQMPNWKTDGFEFGKKYKIYEIYCLMPKSAIDKENGQGDTTDDTIVEGMAILTLENSDKANVSGKILFIEQAECELEEVWYEKVDGRWLGRGPVEQQLENQIATNLSVNLRRKGLLHSSKHLYQTGSEDVAKNLVKDVKDGEVIYVGPNGNITPIMNETRNLSEFNADDALFEKAMQQSSFTYEVATGEALPSGTPFRLGVILSQAVETHYSLKREQFGLFLKRSFFSQLIPMFKKQTKEHTLSVASTSEGAGYLRSAMVEYKAKRAVIDSLLAGKTPPDATTLKSHIEQELIKSPYMYVDVPEGFYDDVKFRLDLNITGESEDISKQVETLTTLYQSLVQKGDPRADRILEVILSKTGMNLQSIAGTATPPQNPVAPNIPNTGTLPARTPQNATATA